MGDEVTTVIGHPGSPSCAPPRKTGLSWVELCPLSKIRLPKPWNATVWKKAFADVVTVGSPGETTLD